MPDPISVDAGSCDVLLLLADELSTAGDHAEGLVDRAGSVLRPGGLLLVSVASALPARAGSSGQADRGEAATSVPEAPRHFTALELRRLLAHRGFDLAVLAAPGAWARLAGTTPRWDREADRAQGLLDTTPRLLAAATSPPSQLARSRTFFGSIARKVVAVAVVCRDAEGRLLCVHDSFKGHWTIPGGVVDADEGLGVAAERETWEEAGVGVRAGVVLGTFAASWPDRIVVVFEAAPLDPAAGPPSPVHEHEVDAAAWLPLDMALARLAAGPRSQVERCLDEPNRAWHD